MKNEKTKKALSVLLILALAMSALAGCAPRGTDTPPASSPSQIFAPTIPTWDGETLRFKPSDLGIAPKETYEYPYMGLTAVIPQDLLALMEAKDVVMLTSADYNPNETFNYAALCWYALTEDQKNEEFDSVDLDAWTKTLSTVGVLGAYQAEFIPNLDTITGCTQHTELGKSPDGLYTYYLSLSDAGGPAARDLLAQTQVTLTEPLALDMYRGADAFAEARVEASNLGDFTATDINGNQYTAQELFGNYDLTLVNVFTTWCSYCVEEMPALEKLTQEMSDQGVHVISVVHDTADEDGNVRDSVVELAKTLQERAGITFPMLIPDETDMNGRLRGIYSYPESFFVDRDGNIVGETYMGAKSFDAWKDIVEQELAKIKEG